MKPSTSLLVAAATVLTSSPGIADSGWRVDLSARGIGSIELSDAEQTRDGLVPALGVRALRSVGRVQLGGALGAGMPAYHGKADAALSIDHERVLARPRCALVVDGGNTLGREQCDGARWSLALGLDAGVGLFYFDAPPETPSSSNALLYWGPLARARVQLHVLGMLPAARGVGVVVGANAALASARYMTTASGAGLRLEPELELGLTLRL